MSRATLEQRAEQALSNADERDEALAAIYGSASKEALAPEVVRGVAAADLPHLREVPLADFMSADPASVSYAVHPILPRGVVSLITGHGGAGKSTATLILLAHAACGEPWVGFHPDGVTRSVYASLEDPGELVRYRLRRIAETYRLEPRKIEANLRVLDCTSNDAALATETIEYGVRSVIATHLFQELRSAVTGADVVVIDNASDAFSGNENERKGVRAFMRHLADLARQENAAVGLLAHIDKAAARNGSGSDSYSGSTAWHNSARSRIALLVKEDSSVLLVHEKLNLGKKADPVRLAWSENGVLIESRTADQASAGEDGTNGALLLLLSAEQAGVVVPTGTSGPATSWHAVQHLPEVRERFEGKTGRVRFHAALVQAQRTGLLERSEFKDAHRNTRERWQLTHLGRERASEISAADMREFVSPPTPPVPTNARGPVRVGTGSGSTHATNATNADGAEAYRRAKAGGQSTS